MANADIVGRMREACCRWDAGTIDCLALGTQLVGLAGAMEGTPRQVVEEAREFGLALEVASAPASFDEREVAIARVDAVLSRIRLWLDAVDIA